MREQVELAQADAVNAVVAFLEADVVKSRVGAGGVGQIDVTGIAAAAFVHHESRSVDPHLHTHLVVSNKVQGTDGRWRTIDSQALYFAAVAASETYNAALADALTHRLGVIWWDREVTRGKRTVREIAGISDALVDVFSSRRRQITPRLAELEAEFAVRTGRVPSRGEREQLSHQAWREQRPVKDPERPSLREFFTAWAATAEHTLRQAQVRTVDPSRSLVRETVLRTVGPARPGPRPAPPAVPVDDASVARLAGEVVDAVSETRSAFTARHLQAEALRRTASVRCGTEADRRALVDRVVTAATGAASLPGSASGGTVLLAAPPRVAEPAVLRRADGTSVFTRHKADRFTTRQILAAEAAILDAALMPGTVRLAVDGRLGTAVVDRVAAVTGRPLGADQAAAVHQVATDGRTVSSLVGPAGTGKSTTLTTLVAVWTAGHGPGRVLACAPSAAAAQVLTESLGAAGAAVDGVQPGALTDRDGWRTAGPVVGRTLHSLLTDLRTPETGRPARLVLQAGDLVVLDEAGMAPTLLLAELTAHVRAAGAKLLLVGDDAQLGAVEAGGALKMLTAASVPEAASGLGTSVATLDGVWRFAHPWERDATLRLRTGDPSVVDEYARHGRLLEGDADRMLDAAYSAWQADERAGRTSLLVAADNQTVTALNQRARADRVAARLVAGDGIALPDLDGTVIGVGDRIVTRRNTRDVQVLKGSDVVRNGDTWTVTAVGDDGSLRVRSTRHGGAATLPADYVQRFVELGYATTAHRAQGATVDTAHLILTPALVRETAYVGMTRGRHANTAYVVTGDPVTGPETHQPTWAAGEPASGADVWASVLATAGAEPAAHVVVADELRAEESLATLVPRYEFAAQTWHALGWPALVDDVLLVRGITPDRYPDLRGAPGTPAGTTVWAASPALVALSATLSASGRHGLDPALMLRRALADGALTPDDGVRDPVAVLQARVEKAVASINSWDEDRGQRTERRAATWFVGLTPRMPTVDVADPQVADLATYLDDLADAIEERATEVALAAVRDGARWLPTPPAGLARLSHAERATLLAQDPASLSAPVAGWWAACRTTAARRDADATEPTRALRAPASGSLQERVRQLAEALDQDVVRTPPAADLLPAWPRDAGGIEL